MRAFFCSEIENSSPKLSAEEKKHLFKVLRAKEGDTILLLNGKGKTARAKITKNDNIIIEEIITFTAPDKEINLFVAPPRHSGMDQLIAYSCETPVKKIIPIICRNSVAISNNIEKWRKKIIESCKQSKNPLFPEISKLIDFDSALIQAKGSTILFGSTEEDSRSILNITNKISWFVGPEGGFTNEEIRKLKEYEGIPLKLSPYTLRIETAALAGIIFLSNIKY